MAMKGWNHENGWKHTGKICGEDKRAPEYGEKEKECAGVSGNQWLLCGHASGRGTDGEGSGVSGPEQRRCAAYYRWRWCGWRRDHSDRWGRSGCGEHRPVRTGRRQHWGSCPYVLKGDRQGAPVKCWGRDRTGPENGRGRPGSEKASGRGQFASGSQHCQEICRPWNAVLRPDPGR